jgi:Rieske Fe-S protein
MGASLNRRKFLKISGGAVTMVALVRCNGGSSFGEFPVGNASDFTVGTITLFDEGPIFVGRDDEGLYAMSAVCTHNGCMVELGTNELRCPCHGATYDLDGVVTGGPASRSLEHFEVSVNSKNDVVIDTTRDVSTTTRVAVQTE